MKTMCETLETRRLMSATTTLAAEVGDTETHALLLPAVQAAREAARSSSSGPGGGPVVKVFSGGTVDTGPSAGSHHTGGVNMSFADGSVRFVRGGID